MRLRPLHVLAALTLSAMGAEAAPSTIVYKGIEMPVKSGVAVWDAKTTYLKLFLLPFEPTAAEIQLLQKGETLWLYKKPPVDAKKWATWNPHAELMLDWSFEKAGVNDLSKLSNCVLYQYDFARAAQNTFIRCKKMLEESTLNGTLKGRLQEGETITIAAKGQGKADKGSSDETATYAWDFSITTKVVPEQPE